MTFEMTKEWFAKQMQKIVESAKWLDELWDMQIFNEDVLDKIAMKIEQPVDMISEIMGDRSDWIGYWLYELDGGKKWEPGSVEDENGAEIKLQTIEDLWNLLTKE